MKKTRFSWFKALAFFLLLMIYTSTLVLAQIYKPVLPASVPTTELVVLDLIKDIFPPDGSNGRKTVHDDVLLTLTAIQGLVNRTSPSKIYFLNEPTYYPDSWKKESKFHAENQWMLDLNLYPVPIIKPEVDNNKTYPVLSYLLKHYSSFIKGKVIYPQIAGADLENVDIEKVRKDQNKDIEKIRIPYAPESAAIGAAITACGIEDAIPVSTTIDGYIHDEGYNFTLIADTRNLTSNEAAFDWARKNYFKPETNRKFVGLFMYEWIYSPSFHDYYIANRAFVTVLNPQVNDQKNRMSDLLKDYPVGAPCLGCVVGNEDDYSDFGSTITITEIGNTSATSSFILDPSTLPTPPSPKPLLVKNNGVYASFYVGDGDVPGLVQNQEIEIFMKHQSALDEIYYDIQVCPYYMDLNPPLMKYWMENQSRHISLSTSLNDGSAPKHPDGRMFYKKTLKYYYDHARNNLLAYNHFYDPSFDCSIFINPYLKMYGWGDLVTNPSPVKPIPGTNSIQIQIADPHRLKMDYETWIRKAMENTNGNEPIFILMKCGGGWGNSIVEEITKIKKAMDALKANPSSGREIYFCTPVDLAATWKQWKGIPAALPERDLNPEYPYPKSGL